MKEWTDPQLGRFVFNEYQWQQKCLLDAFSVFSYAELKKPADELGQSITVAFLANDENDIPTTQAIKVGVDTIENHQALLAEGVAGLFDDFHGKGRNTGMWWRSDINHIKEIVASRAATQELLPINTPSDVHRLLSSPSIFIDGSGYNYDEPLSILMFEAIFEPEHGIGFLTDGAKILGLGYQVGVRPYK
ncbi:MAG: hypothetical protein ACPG47_11635 [Leucothrix sp.]